jgi:prepilin-type processing-associated H-X9-DG protein
VESIIYAARVAADLHVTVAFADGHVQRWPLPEGQTPDDVREELRQVIAGGQWFRVPGGTRVYSPYAIVSVDVAELDPEAEQPSVARKLGEVVATALADDDARATPPAPPR